VPRHSSSNCHALTPAVRIQIPQPLALRLAHAQPNSLAIPVQDPDSRPVNATPDANGIGVAISITDRHRDQAGDVDAAGDARPIASGVTGRDAVEIPGSDTISAAGAPAFSVA
jgi:hypothetical protein